jgi:hypothetical protein
MRELLTQVETLAELLDGGLSRRDIRGRCRREQPAGEHPFSRAQPRCGQ